MCCTHVSTASVADDAVHAQGKTSLVRHISQKRVSQSYHATVGSELTVVKYGSLRDVPVRRDILPSGL